MKNSRLSVHLENAGPTYFRWPGESRPTGILLLHHGLCSCVSSGYRVLLQRCATRVAIDRLSAFAARQHAMRFNDSGLASWVELLFTS
jgi:hypothetical protein